MSSLLKWALAFLVVSLIAALYSDRSSVSVEATVAFEDGRTSVVRAELKILSTQTFDHSPQRLRA